MPAVAAAAAAAAATAATTPAGGIIDARRSKEAAYYGVDAMELTDRATQIISDYVEGALADVRAQLVEALRRRGAGAAGGGDGADAFYEEHVAPRAAAFLARMHKHLDRNADKFELYLARNIFKAPVRAAAAGASAGEDAMEVDGQGKGKEDEEEGGAVPLPASASEVPPPQDEEAMDNLLTEARVRIRTLRRQRKAVEAMQAKAVADLDITQKEAHALRVRVLQALSLGQDGAEATEGGAMGGLAELLEVVRAQGQEAAQLVLQAEGLIPQLAARQRQRQDGGEGMETGGSSQGGSSQGSSSGGGGLAASGVAIAPDMSDIRTHTKAHLKGLAAALAPGARV